MAEIKSTWEKVMERMASMDAAVSREELASEEAVKQGMRLAAAFMRGEGSGLGAALEGRPAEERRLVQQGMIRTLLRNIMLPREESQQEDTARAIEGLLAIGQGAGDLVAVFQEMKSVLDRYREHRQQLKQQLEDHFSQQMGQLEEKLASQTGVQMKLQPSQHPKFQEEWQRLVGELNDQYGRALRQYKELIEQHLGG